MSVSITNPGTIIRIDIDSIHKMEIICHLGFEDRYAIGVIRTLVICNINSEQCNLLTSDFGRFDTRLGDLETGRETKDGKSVGSALLPLFDQLWTS